MRSSEPRRTALAFVLASVSVAAMVACDPPRPTPPDSGLDAPADSPDAPPPDPCPPLGPLLELTDSTCPELDAGDRFCVSQDTCALFIVGGSGVVVTATITDREAALEIGGIRCVATLDDDGGAELDCDDSIGIGCSAVVRGIAVSERPLCCVPGDASCASPAACTLVAPSAAGAIATTACVETTGAVMEGGPCIRVTPGHDDCAAGLFCTTLGAASGERACRRLCLSDAGCAASDVCTRAGVVPPVGLCAARCDPFGVDACGAAAALSCQPVPALDAATTVTICSGAGTGTSGELCEAVGCASALVCAVDVGTVARRCRVFCDDTHPCGTGETCRPFSAGASLGACSP